MKKFVGLIILIVGIIVSDQLTKHGIRANFDLGETVTVIKGFFNITYVRNPGAAFGMLGRAHDYIRYFLFLFIPVVACFWLAVLMWKSKKSNFLLSTAYALILAGAIGNLIDRFTLNYVVDFIDFHYSGSHFPAFNIADSSITVAAFLLIYDFIISIKNGSSESE